MAEEKNLHRNERSSSQPSPAKKRRRRSTARRVFNIIVLGLAARHMNFTKKQWLTVIEKTVPPKTVEINRKAFLVGYGE